MLDYLHRFLTPDEEASPAKDFEEHLNRRAYRILPLVGIVGLVAFIPYFALDQDINPDKPMLLFLRLGLSVVGLLSLVAYFIPYFWERGVLILAFFGAYLLWGTAVITALTGGHPSYMGGFNFVLMCSLLSLLPLRIHYPILVVSLLLFLGVLFSVESPMVLWQSSGFRYSLQDLLTSWAVAAIFYYMVYQARQRSFDTYIKARMQGKLLKRQNEKITSSLRYAKQIQRAVLGDSNPFLGEFRDSFILNRPKDIVSGDFYWSFELPEEKGRILVMGDCTGHGVPAALMTMLTVTLLDSLIHQENIFEPSEILRHLDERLIEAFSTGTESRSIIGGADLSVLLFNADLKSLRYASAKNVILVNRQGELHKLMTSRNSVGAYRRKREKNFEGKELLLQEGDQIYLSSDGFQDQYNYLYSKKISRYRFHKLLKEVGELPMEKQREGLVNFLDSWRMGDDQTDDILVLGLRV
ncbi:MAG: SpoIIE family protein phosphatase [Bacteroidota bacterium]